MSEMTWADRELALQESAIKAGAAKSRGDEDELRFYEAEIRRLEGNPEPRDFRRYT